MKVEPPAQSLHRAGGIPGGTRRQEVEPCRQAGGLQADGEDERQEGWEADVRASWYLAGRPATAGNAVGEGAV